MKERIDVITVNGNPLTLVGEGFTMGQSAPDVTLIDNDLQPVKISDFKGKVVVLSVVGSLDTDVCDMQTRRFNNAATELGDDVVILTVSMDLPFAQAYYYVVHNISNLQTLSDHREASFGTTYGVLIKEFYDC